MNLKNTMHTILLVEDDPDDQQFIKDAFRISAPTYHVDIAERGKTALEYLNSRQKEELPCLIVMDYNMPEMTGIELLKELSQKREFFNIPKVVFSTARIEQFVKESMNYGAHSYIIKPSFFNQLIEITKEMIALCEHHANVDRND